MRSAMQEKPALHARCAGTRAVVLPLRNEKIISTHARGHDGTATGRTHLHEKRRRRRREGGHRVAARERRGRGMGCRPQKFVSVIEPVKALCCTTQQGRQCAKLGEAAAMPPLRLDSATRVCAATEKASGCETRGACAQAHRNMRRGSNPGGASGSPVGAGREASSRGWVDKCAATKNAPLLLVAIANAGIGAMLSSASCESRPSEGARPQQSGAR